MTATQTIICPEDVPIWGTPQPESDISEIESDVLTENEQLERSFVCRRCGEPLDVNYYTQIAIRSSRWPDNHGFDLCCDCEDAVIHAMLMVMGILDVRDS